MYIFTERHKLFKSWRTQTDGLRWLLLSRGAACGSPQRVGGEEGHVEGLLLGVVLQGDQHGVAEPHVGQQLQAHQAVAGRAVVGVQHLTWVEELATGRGRLEENNRER